MHSAHTYFYWTANESEWKKIKQKEIENQRQPATGNWQLKQKSWSIHEDEDEIAHRDQKFYSRIYFFSSPFSAHKIHHSQSKNLGCGFIGFESFDAVEC